MNRKNIINTLCQFMLALFFLILFLGQDQTRAQSFEIQNNPSIKREIQITDWDTDGYWYFFWKNSHETILAFSNEDRSDVVLDVGNGGWWINKNRAATETEIRKAKEASVVNGVSPECSAINISTEGNTAPAFNDPTNVRVVMRNNSGELVRSFSILRKIFPPKKIDNVLQENHMDSGDPLLVSWDAPSYPLAVLKDCSLLMKFQDGIVRFDAEGRTGALLSSDLRVVDSSFMDKLSSEFSETSYSKYNYEKSLQKKIDFFYKKIFESNKK